MHFIPDFGVRVLIESLHQSMLEYASKLCTHTLVIMSLVEKLHQCSFTG